MIGIQLEGRLGNHMFQYAAARAAAERRGWELVIQGPGRGKRAMAKRLLRAIIHPGQVPGDLGSNFPNVTRSAASLAVDLGGESIRRRIFPHTFSAPMVEGDRGAKIETVDDQFFSVLPRTWLSGYFQSEAYFADRASDVRHWFEISEADSEHVQNVIKQWPAPPGRMCSIHVRRTDYIRQRKRTWCDRDLGWALPNHYYERALAILPPDLSFAVFSDDVGFAREHFQSLRPWVSFGNSAIQDLALMSCCRYQIIANSSFSWWAAWLNRWPDKLVIAPKFHLGWSIAQWVPARIQVNGWLYVDVI